MSVETGYLQLVSRSITGALDTRLPLDCKFNIQNVSNFKKLLSSGSVRTLIGAIRLENIRFCIEQVLVNNIPGDFFEAGCWRGGAIIYMKACLMVYENKYKSAKIRRVWSADLFPENNTVITSKTRLFWIKQFARFEKILPAIIKNKIANNFMEAFPNEDYTHSTINKIFALIKNTPYVEKEDLISTSASDLQECMQRYALLDERVHFLPGWFKDTLPKAIKSIEELAILRIDADFYLSTLEVLTFLYDKLVIGGFCIIDDYGGFDECRKAVDEFRLQRKINAEIHWIDNIACYWVKS